MRSWLFPPRRKGRKAFSQPPFWSQPDPWLTFAAPWSPPDRERIGNDFRAYVRDAYKADGIVFACAVARQWVFSEARFQWQELRDGRPGDLFGSPELTLLEDPWPTGTTGELLSRMECDNTCAGNFYATTADDAGRLGRAATGPGRRVVRVPPQWTALLIGSPSDDINDLRAKVIALIYEPPPSGIGSRGEPTILLPGEFVHYSPLPDPDARFRGMSWLTPVLREVSADKAATEHKVRFFENGASLRTVVSFDKDISVDAFDAFVARFKAAHDGVENAYKTLFVGGGADPTVVSADLKSIDFKAVQGAGETRIAAAARVPPVIVGLSEGLAGSSLNAGNYGAAKRSWVDGAMRPLWRMAAASLSTLVTKPREGVRLWYDARDVPFLREDAKDEADIQSTEAGTIRELVDAGFNPDDVVDAVTARDLRRLKGRHSGLFSVQLQPANATTAPDDTAPPAGES